MLSRGAGQRLGVTVASAPAVRRAPVTLGGSARVRALRSRVLTPGGGAVALTLLFLAISAWWLHVDRSVPSGDPGKHLGYAFQEYDYLKSGLLWEAFKDAGSKYPLLVHLIGGIGLLVGGLGIGKAVLTLNLVFVPLLAFGVYQTGKLVAGARVGLYALIFVFASPMVITQFHVFMIDMPLASLVALAVYFLLASENFSKLRYAALAGVAIGFGMLTKESFAYWVAGVGAVMLLRGGWRQWKGILTAGVIAAAIAVPWYAVNWDNLQQTAQIARDTVQNYDPSRSVSIYSFANFAWWGWAMTFIELLVPMTIFFAVGLLTTAWRRLKRLPGPRYAAELFFGGLVGWILTAVSLTPDQRYSLPALVFMSVFGTLWLTYLRRPLRIAAVGVLVAVFAVNTAMTNFGPREQYRILFGGLPFGNARALTLATGYGFAWTNQPFNGHMLELMQSARAQGAGHFAIEPGMAGDEQFTIAGMTELGREAGLEMAPNNDPFAMPGGHDVYIFRGDRRRFGKPCATGGIDGTPVYVSYRPGMPAFCPPGTGGVPKR